MVQICRRFYARCWMTAYAVEKTAPSVFAREPPKARGSRRGAERPRASLHPAKTVGGCPGYPSESPRWRIGRRPTPSSRPRHRARRACRAVSRLEAAQDGVVPSLAAHRRTVIPGTSFFSNFRARRHSHFYPPSRARAYPPYGPHRPYQDIVPQCRTLREAWLRLLGPTKFAARDRCSPLSSVRGGVGGDQSPPVDAASARFSLIDG